MNKLFFGLLVALATTALSGCALYFGEDHDDDTWTYCGADGYYSCQDENCRWVSATCPAGGGSGAPGGFECQSNADCAAGCYCATSGTCEEAGFCTSDADCGDGYTCNEARSSCEPVSCICYADSQAVAQGYDYCDEATLTCKTGNDPAGTCAATDPAPTCGTLPPACTPGDVPLLGADGCWNGECQGASDCAVPPACKWLNTQDSCTARTDCAVVVNGINCKKPDGSACQAGDANCSCDSYTYASCRDASVQ